MTKKHKAILYIILSAFCFAMMNVFVRLSGDLPTIQKSFFRNFIAFLVAGVILAKDKNRVGVKVKDLPLLILRSTMGTIGILCNFYAVDHLLISDASMLNKMSPFFAIIFSFIFLKEIPKLFQTVCVILAFVGSLFIIKPGMDFSQTLPSVIGLIGGMGAGAAYTAVRALSNRGVKGPFIVFFFSGFSCLVTVPFIIMAFAPMTLEQVAVLLLAGLSAAGGQFAITAAYANAPAKEISVFDYSQIIFAAVLGYFMFQQIPDGYSFLGYVVICSVSVAMFFYNQKN